MHGHPCNQSWKCKRREVAVGEREEEGWERGAWGREEREKEEGQDWEVRGMAEEATRIS